VIRLPNGTETPMVQVTTKDKLVNKLRILLNQGHSLELIRDDVTREFISLLSKQEINEIILQILHEREEEEKQSLENIEPHLELLEREKRADIEAEDILKTGKPFKKFLTVFQQDHEGDLTVARSIGLTFASSSVVNGDGLHTYVSGSSGRGKSHAAGTMFEQLPDRYRYNRSFSDKYLYYAGTDKDSGLIPGCVVLIDDQAMSPQVQELFKVSTSKFHEQVDYGTVHNQKAMTLKMPKEISWVLLKVDDPGDDQTMNRLIQARVDESEEKIASSAMKIRNKYTNLSSKAVIEIRFDLLVVRAMWKRIKDSRVAVDVPCAHHILFADQHNLRTHELFFNLMMCHAVIHQWQRKVIGNTQDGIPIIQANYEDYKEAKMIFEALHIFGGQKFNTLKSEDQVLDAILVLNPHDGIFTLTEVARVCNLPTNVVYRAVKGRMDKGMVLGGLLNKCPFIQVKGKRGVYELESDITYRGEGRETVSKKSFNEEVYVADIDSLRVWREGGGALTLDISYKWEN
jgi:hypothetical protein